MDGACNYVTRDQDGAKKFLTALALLIGNFFLLIATITTIFYLVIENHFHTS